MTTSRKPPRLPEGTDPLAALRQLQEQLASARYHVGGRGGYQLEDRTRDEGARDSERTAGMNLAPIVTAVEELVADLRRKLAEPRCLACGHTVLDPGHRVTPSSTGATT